MLSFETGSYGLDSLFAKKEIIEKELDHFFPAAKSFLEIDSSPMLLKFFKN